MERYLREKYRPNRFLLYLQKNFFHAGQFHSTFGYLFEVKKFVLVVDDLSRE